MMAKKMKKIKIKKNEKNLKINIHIEWFLSTKFDISKITYEEIFKIKFWEVQPLFFDEKHAKISYRALGQSEPGRPERCIKVKMG